MFMARHRRSARRSSVRNGPACPVSGRQALWVNTLERRYDFHLGEAIRAAIEGSHDKATKHSGTALSISRELYAGAPDPARHQPELAAALCTHARYRAGWQAIAMLAESAGHYAELAEADPAVYEVAQDRRAHAGRAGVGRGGQHRRPPSACCARSSGCTSRRPRPIPRNATSGWPGPVSSSAAACSRPGSPDDGLAEIDTGLELAAEVLDRLGARDHGARLARLRPPVPAARGPGLVGGGGPVDDRARGGGPMAAGRDLGPGRRPDLGRPGGPRRRDAPRRARGDHRPGGGYLPRRPRLQALVLHVALA